MGEEDQDKRCVLGVGESEKGRYEQGHVQQSVECNNRSRPTTSILYCFFFVKVLRSLVTYSQYLSCKITRPISWCKLDLEVSGYRH